MRVERRPRQTDAKGARDRFLKARRGTDQRSKTESQSAVRARSLKGGAAHCKETLDQLRPIKCYFGTLVRFTAGASLLGEKITNFAPKILTYLGVMSRIPRHFFFFVTFRLLWLPQTASKSHFSAFYISVIQRSTRLPTNKTKTSPSSKQ